MEDEGGSSKAAGDPMFEAGVKPMEHAAGFPEARALQSELLLNQIIDRDCLSDFSIAIEGGDLGRAYTLAVGQNPRTLGHELIQLRIRDLLGDPDRLQGEASSGYRDALVRALELQQQAAAARDQIVSEAPAAVLEEDLISFQRAMMALYDHLESMVSISAKKEYVDKRVARFERIMQERPTLSQDERAELAAKIEALKRAGARNGIK